ncbi:MAG: peptidoglycan DD-metalloendopeptidase family protein [Bacteroidaceae bacterium]|nr:peptidoglycan DD-metalloendopeptidase family protein [Bacteroidaceae bacterium]MCF0187107.1 peptidoglycan DD-metalloendopeptidase family protein [Bacteroidaceae bacterium]
MIFDTLKITAIGVMAMFSTHVAAQDLIASQAPIDRKIRAVDSVALQRLVVKENTENPSASLYPSWDNSFVGSYADVTIPDTYEIDLRGFAMPTTNRTITSNYGRRWGRAHKGIDVKVYVGDTIRAAFSGKIRMVAYEGRGYGKYIVIRHDNGLETVYGHLSKQLVRENQEVHAGDVIGLGGNTGRSTGSHLHFETRFLGVAINPALLFNFPMQDVTGDFYTFRKGRSGVVSKGSTASSSKVSDSTNDKNAPRYHKIHRGDTLSSIARKYGLTVDQLCKLNGINSKATLREGKVLKCS